MRVANEAGPIRGGSRLLSMFRAVIVGLGSGALLFMPCRAAPAEEDATSDEAIQMILGLLGDADREMRAIGLQYVREESPGETATGKPGSGFSKRS